MDGQRRRSAAKYWKSSKTEKWNDTENRTIQKTERYRIQNDTENRKGEKIWVKKQIPFPSEEAPIRLLLNNNI